MQLSKFNQGDFVLSTLLNENGEILFDARSVCKSLDLANVSRALDRLDSDGKIFVSKELQKGVTTSNTPVGGFQDRWFITESGLYLLIFTSRKDFAKKFQRWVTNEVLPEIRKKGSYSVDKKLSDDEMIGRSLLLVSDRLEKAKNVIANQDKTIKKLSGEANVRVSQQAIIGAASEIAEAKRIPHAITMRSLYDQYKKLHGEDLKLAWKNHKREMGLKTMRLYKFILDTGRGKKYIQAKQSLVEAFVVASNQMSFTEWEVAK